jgi:hypothetical protein
MWLWTIATGGALVAIVSFVGMRRLARKLARLTQSYWELRYEYTQLRSELRRLDPGQQGDEPNQPPRAPAPDVSYVPLSSLKK